MKKADLDKLLSEVKKELQNIDQQFPKEISELKDRITECKRTTEDYERKTEILAEELKKLKQQQTGGAPLTSTNTANAPRKD